MIIIKKQKQCAYLSHQNHHDQVYVHSMVLLVNVQTNHLSTEGEGT